MKKYKIENSDLEVSSVVVGCMRHAEKSAEEIEELILTALDEGVNFFDHADIYGGGKSEELFGTVLEKHPELREKMIIQTKCGIIPGVMYDFSKEHILNSVDESLARLKTDYVDVLLLHRPDALMDPRVVAEAFNELHESGKVRYFGVSNMNASQIALLQKYCSQKILFNQMQFSVVNAQMVEVGINVNMMNNGGLDRDGDTLNYCRLNDITIQAWSILQIDLGSGSYLNHPDYKALNEKLNELADKYNVSPACIATAWILKHPANMQAIAGTTSPAHLKDLCKAADITITNEEWYQLYLSVDRILP